MVAVDFQGGDDPESAIAKEANQQVVTLIRARDLVRLLLLSVPKQIGLSKIRELLGSCHTPREVTDWISAIEREPVNLGPVKEVIEAIYQLQRDDTEAPELASVRIKLNQVIGTTISKLDLKALIESLRGLAPGFVTVDGERIGVQARPEKVIEVINGAINRVPNEFQNLYLEAFASVPKPKD